ncbi:ATP-grasp domain-containing protein [Aporhodopirellula aestuarii]|uniref:ATP-grasp domain-containing protein n=1 Tax=Aporhodopirellula aestuarii TaxID=2950107 RepID=A0ABT0TX27_9BACT|nr:hypothetical protein [Aporhodopirellula aestuarii]MCM2369151.1 hypothetical protein [Aporhodopirellula aestuarii]
MNRTVENPRILLSEGSSNSARQTLYGLAPGYPVDILDPSPWCQCRFSTHVRRRIACPQIAKDPIGYVRFVARLVSEGRYDVLFPTHEQVYAFSRFRDLFQKRVGLAVPEFAAIQRVQSKAEFAVLMDELGLPTPVTKIVHTQSELLAHDDFPCFIKVAHSTASLGVERVGNATELRQTVTRFTEADVWWEGQPIVIQQPAPGRQAEVSAVFQDGRLVGAACADVLATGIGGGPALRRTAIHPPVLEHVERFGNTLNWNGPVSLEYFYDAESQQPFYIECNPRIGESFNALLGGVNLCEATVRIALGERVERLPAVQPGVLSHNGFIVMIADAYNGASRGQLLRKLWHHWTRQDGCESEMTRPAEDLLSLIPATAVITMLLVNPKSARDLAKGTVDNYSLPHAAAQRIDEMPQDVIAEIQTILL